MANARSKRNNNVAKAIVGILLIILLAIGTVAGIGFGKYGTNVADWFKDKEMPAGNSSLIPGGIIENGIKLATRELPNGGGLVVTASGKDAEYDRIEIKPWWKFAFDAAFNNGDGTEPAWVTEMKEKNQPSNPDQYVNFYDNQSWNDETKELTVTITNIAAYGEPVVLEFFSCNGGAKASLQLDYIKRLENVRIVNGDVENQLDVYSNNLGISRCTTSIEYTFGVGTLTPTVSLDAPRTSDLALNTSAYESAGFKTHWLSGFSISTSTDNGKHKIALIFDVQKACGDVADELEGTKSWSDEMKKAGSGSAMGLAAEDTAVTLNFTLTNGEFSQSQSVSIGVSLNFSTLNGQVGFSAIVLDKDRYAF